MLGQNWEIPYSTRPRVSTFGPVLVWIRCDLFEAKKFSAADCFPAGNGVCLRRRSSPSLRTSGVRNRGGPPSLRFSWLVVLVEEKVGVDMGLAEAGILAVVEPQRRFLLCSSKLAVSLIHTPVHLLRRWLLCKICLSSLEGMQIWGCFK